MSHTETAPARILPKRRTPDVPTAQVSLADAVATFELNALPLEAARYLATVDTFRAAGAAPTWRAETEELPPAAFTFHTETLTDAGPVLMERGTP